VGRTAPTSILAAVVDRDNARGFNVHFDVEVTTTLLASVRPHRYVGVSCEEGDVVDGSLSLVTLGNSAGPARQVSMKAPNALAGWNQALLSPRRCSRPAREQSLHPT
jgi:hypothetical protein